MYFPKTIQIIKNAPLFLLSRLNPIARKIFGIQFPNLFSLLKYRIISAYFDYILCK